MFKNLRFVYITTKNRKEARKIGSELVKEKLAACANIIDNMESIYEWNGKIKNDQETVLIVKTTYGNMSDLTKRVKELHSYEVPCVISINLSEQEGNEEYLDWLENTVRSPLPSDNDNFTSE